MAFDQRMAMEDIAGSRAHAAMLASVGVLSEEELLQINQGLDQVEEEIRAGRFAWSVELAVPASGQTV